jgi:hypothetical protein
VKIKSEAKEEVVEATLKKKTTRKSDDDEITREMEKISTDRKRCKNCVETSSTSSSLNINYDENSPLILLSSLLACFFLILIWKYFLNILEKKSCVE